MVWVGGLSAGTVYRFSVKLYWVLSNGVKYYFGDRSEWYYSVTYDTTQKSKARSAIVLRALKQYGDSLFGRVGYNGSLYRDGTRYGADVGEYWCSEFYSWSTRDKLKFMSGRQNVDSLLQYFRAYLSLYEPSKIRFSKSYRGDYLAIGAVGVDNETHSGMFLAYEPGQDRVWTIEGNIDDKVEVMWWRTPTGDEIKKVGYIT